MVLPVEPEFKRALEELKISLVFSWNVTETIRRFCTDLREYLAVPCSMGRRSRCRSGQSRVPCSGGLPLHPTVNLSFLKVLGFEQMFKNALTEKLNMGGGKATLIRKSDSEIRRFCIAFLGHIGSDTDVPAGDIGTGAREIGYLSGA